MPITQASILKALKNICRQVDKKYPQDQIHPKRQNAEDSLLLRSIKARRQYGGADEVFAGRN